MIQEPIISSTLLIFLRPRSRYERKTSEKRAKTRAHEKRKGQAKKEKTKLQKHKGALFFDSVPQAILTDFLDALHFFHRYFTQLI